MSKWMISNWLVTEQIRYESRVELDDIELPAFRFHWKMIFKFY